jgi:8-oxo-dGTP pyrophosphatase MutT (NUDIX family)
MLHLIPPPLHRRLYRAADRARRLWWRIRKPRRTSVLVAAFDDRGRLLLVRHSYGPQVWALPGGGIGRAEDPASAAAREFREELGCDLADIALAEATEEEDSGSHDLRHLFTAGLAGTPKPDMREIVAIGLFGPDELPVPCDRRVRRAIALAKAARSKQR